MEKLDPREIRRKLGLNQQQFWSPLGVTQSGGSRYETGHKMPNPVQHLLRLVYVEKIDIAKIRKDDWAVIGYLQQHDKKRLAELKKEAKAAAKAA